MADKKLPDDLNAVIKNHKLDNVISVSEGEQQGARVTISPNTSVRDLQNFQRALSDLEVIQKYDEEFVTLSEDFPVFPFDGAIALAKAIKQMFGVVTQAPFFLGDKRIEPMMFGIAVSVTETVQVPWGGFKLPGIAGIVRASHGTKDERVVFSVIAEIRHEDEDKIKELFVLTRKIAEEESVYRGKAIIIKLTDKYGELKGMPEIEFLSTARIPKPIFSRSIEEEIELNILTPIRRLEGVRKAGEYLKRGILLAGGFGTGKTLLAAEISRESVKYGWTFIYVPNVHELSAAIGLARLYQPCVIFAEDIDRAAGQQRTESVNELLNKLDDVGIKDSDILVILTTNYPENINVAMYRPGRFDAVISIESPDAEAGIRLVESYVGNLLKKGENLSEVGKLLEGQIPAVIAEVVKRAKFEAIRRSGSAQEILAEHLIAAATGIKKEQEFINKCQGGDSKTDPTSDLADKLVERVVKAILNTVEELRVSAGGDNK